MDINSILSLLSSHAVLHMKVDDKSWWHVANISNITDGSDIQGRTLDVTQPLGSLGCLWKLRMFNG